MVVNEQQTTIGQFVRDAGADIVSPTTSTFCNKVHSFREHASWLAENLRNDEIELQQLRRACADVHQASVQMQQAQLGMVKALDALGLCNTRKSAINTNTEQQQLHMGTALLKFSILFKHMASLSGSFAQSLHNSLVFPLQDLLNADMKDKSDLKKSVDKAYKEYENKYSKEEKEIKNQAKDAGWLRGAVSPAELADSLTKERTQLQHSLCSFFLSVHRVHDRKTVNLLQHFIDFYYCQQSLHEDALKCLRDYDDYVKQLVADLDQLKKVRDEERSSLFELQSTLAASPHVTTKSGGTGGVISPRIHSVHYDANTSGTSAQSNQSSPRLSLGSTNQSFRKSDAGGGTADGSPRSVMMNRSAVVVPGATDNQMVTSTAESTAFSDGDDNVSAARDMKGYLLKKSAGKLHKAWQKRAVELRNDKFYLHHSDDSQPAVEINLMTSQIKTSADDRKTFEIFCFNRTYQFQAEDDVTAQIWINALQAAKHHLQTAMFSRASQCSEDDQSPSTADAHVYFSAWSSVANGQQQQSASASTANASETSSSLPVVGLSQRRRAIERIRQMPSNRYCADCGDDGGDAGESQGVSWVSLNLGCLLCIKCSGFHRELGVHVSRIQSISLDKLSTSELLVPLVMPNELFNSVYEASLPPGAKLQPTALAVERRGYIQAKYVGRRYVNRQQSTDALAAAVHAESPADILRYLASEQRLGCTVDMNKGDNALTYVIRHDASGEWLPLQQLLLANGFDPNERTINGEHALHICVENDRAEHLKLLLACRRIDLSVTNTRQQSALQLAEQISPTGQCCKLLQLADSTSPQSSASVRHTFENVRIPDSLLDGSYVDRGTSKLSTSMFKSSTSSSGRPISGRAPDSTDLKFRHLSMLSSHRSSQVASSNGSGIGDVPASPVSEANPYVPLPTATGTIDRRSHHGKGPAPDIPVNSRPPPLPPKPKDAASLTLTKVKPDKQPLKHERYTRSASENQGGFLLDRLVYVSDSESRSRPASAADQQPHPVQPTATTLPRQLPPATGGGHRIRGQPTGRSHSEKHPHHPVPVAAGYRPAESAPSLPPARQLQKADTVSGVGSEHRRCRALYECRPDNADELGFAANELILVSKTRVPGEDDTWMYGHIESDPSRRGIFPPMLINRANYTSRYRHFIPSACRGMGNKHSSPAGNAAPATAILPPSLVGSSGTAGTFQKQLLAMDFDHTVSDTNTDVEVQDLAEDGHIPPEIKQLYSTKCWTDYMQAIFKLLHSQGITEAAMHAYIQRLPLAPGMAQLLDAAGFDSGTDVIIISDANVLFIQWILDHRRLLTAVDKVFSNPAKFDENGCLRIQYYHKQDWCKLSTNNMCKGHILTEFIKDREKSHGVKYTKVVYVGDGGNDLCPATKLNKCDVVCARKGFKLALTLAAQPACVKCTVVEYEHGRQVADVLGLEMSEDDWLQAPEAQIINDT